MNVVHGVGVNHMFQVVTDSYYEECNKIKDTNARLSVYNKFANELKHGSYDELKLWYEICCSKGVKNNV